MISNLSTIKLNIINLYSFQPQTVGQRIYVYLSYMNGLTLPVNAEKFEICISDPSVFQSLRSMRYVSFSPPPRSKVYATFNVSIGGPLLRDTRGLKYAVTCNGHVLGDTDSGLLFSQEGWENVIECLV